jgi:prephenate dehydrogenase
MGVRASLERPKVGIVGGTGDMGSWFADLMKAHVSEVFCVGRTTRITPREIARECDVVVISVPIPQTVAVIKEVGPLISKQGVLMDLTSIKKKSMEAMLHYSRAQVVGVHPLFGPGDASRPKLRVAVCPGRGRDGLNWLSGILNDAGLAVAIMSPERHDHMMGLIQGINHLSTLALGLCVIRSGLMWDELLSCSTQTFTKTLDRIRAMIEQPAWLFGSLLMDNPRALEFMNHYSKAAGDLIEMSKEKDRASFEHFFEDLKEFFRSEESVSHKAID